MMPSIMSGSLIRDDAALGADVGGHPLQRHHGDGAGVLGDLRLLGGDHVHDHAALEHLGHAALDAGGAGAGRLVRSDVLGDGHDQTSCRLGADPAGHEPIGTRSAASAPARPAGRRPARRSRGSAARPASRPAPDHPLAPDATRLGDGVVVEAARQPGAHARLRRGRRSRSRAERVVGERRDGVRRPARRAAPATGRCSAASRTSGEPGRARRRRRPGPGRRPRRASAAAAGEQQRRRRVEQPRGCQLTGGRGPAQRAARPAPPRRPHRAGAAGRAGRRTRTGTTASRATTSASGEHRRRTGLVERRITAATGRGSRRGAGSSRTRPAPVTTVS